MKIIVKEEGLKSIGSNLINNSEELNSEVEKINAAMEGISNAWSGKDADALKYKVLSLYINEVKKLSDSLEEYGKFLKKVPSYYEKSDQKMASKKISI